MPEGGLLRDCLKPFRNSNEKNRLARLSRLDLKNLFFRLQSGIFTDRAESAANPEP